MTEEIDILKIKIEKAKAGLSSETLSAIAAVDWHGVILKMREKKGYNFEQLGDLEIETELLLSGLLSSADYPKELEKRMKISRAQVDELITEMNESVFKKIQEELIKNTEKKKEENKKIPAIKVQTPVPPAVAPIDVIKKPDISKNDSAVLNQAGINVLDRLENLVVPEKLELENAEKLKKEVHPILAQKLSGYLQNEVVETQHSADDMIKKAEAPVKPAPPSPEVPLPPKVSSYPKNSDPYRLSPE